MERSSAGSCSVVTSCPKSFQAAMVGPHKREVGAPPLRWRGSPKRRQWRGGVRAPPGRGGPPPLGHGGQAGWKEAVPAGVGAAALLPPSAVQEALPPGVPP